MQINGFRNKIIIYFYFSPATSHAEDDYEDDFFDNHGGSDDEDTDNGSLDSVDTNDDKQPNLAHRNRQTTKADFEVVKRVDNIYYE